MPPFRSVTSCSPSASARTVTAHSLNAIGMGLQGGTKGSPGQRAAGDARPRATGRIAIVTNRHEFAKGSVRIPPGSRPSSRTARAAPSGRPERARGLAERGAAGGLGPRELDRDPDVELAVGPARDEVLGEQVLEGELPQERVALDAAVGDVPALDPGALAVAQAADAAAGQGLRV